MAIPINSKMKPRAEGKYALVDAEDIEYKQKRLPDFLLELDNNLTTEGKAADAAAVGKALSEIEFVDAKDDGNGIITLGKMNEKKQQKEFITFYCADREQIEGITDYKTEDIYRLYSALGGQEQSIGKSKIDENTEIDIKCFTFSTGEYNQSGRRGELDDFKKPVFLVVSGIHGSERTAVFSTYVFFKDLVGNKGKLPSYLKEGAVFKVIPVAVPGAFDKEVYLGEEFKGYGTRKNFNNVNINRNFNYNWNNNEGLEKNHTNYPGDAANSEDETKKISGWLEDNTDAALLIDLHNSNTYENEVSMFVGLNDEKSTKAKKMALQAMDKIIPYWKTLTKPDGSDEYPSNTIFSYSSFIDAGGGMIYYASSLGIPSISAECLSAKGYSNDIDKYPPERIAAGAEILGNILIEAYNREILLN